MVKLKEEYTDVGHRTHAVEHMTVSIEDEGARERVVEELLRILTRPDGPAHAC